MLTLVPTRLVRSRDGRPGAIAVVQECVNVIISEARRRQLQMWRNKLLKLLFLLLLFVGLRGGPASSSEAIEEVSDQRMAAMLTKWMAMAMAKGKPEEQSNGVGDVSLGDDPSAAPCCIISGVDSRGGEEVRHSQ